MAYIYKLRSDNKFSPQFDPAELSQITPYIDPDTGLPTGNYYNFYGSNIAAVDGDNYIDRFDLMEKGNQELYAMYLILNNNQSTHFNTPNGYYLRFIHYDYWQSGQLRRTFEVFAKDDNGEFQIASMNMGTSYHRWLSFQLDLDNKKAVPMLWTEVSLDPVTGNASFDMAGVLLTEERKQRLYNILLDVMPESDPYADGGYSTGTDTGTGSFDATSESVPLPLSYSLTPTASGLMTQYVMTDVELLALGSWLWNGGTVLDDLKRVFQSPAEAIFSIGILPFTPSDTTNYNVWIGGLNPSVTGKRINTTVEHISMGSIAFDPYYGSALDQNPYTKCEIYLPYCGNFPLNVDEIMGHTISVDYYCDTTTGDCVAFISDEDRVLEQIRGNCFVQIPLSARDFTGVYSSALGAVATVAGGLASAAVTGGMTAPIAVGMGTSMAANAMNAKTHVAKMGGISGMAGLMAIQTPYVILTIPNQCLPEATRDHQGYPLMVTKRLGDFSGFTKVYEIHLDELDCTDAESKEIYDLLKGGVIL